MKKYILYQTRRIGYKTIGTIYASPEKAGDKVLQVHELGGSQMVTTHIVADRIERRSRRPGWKSIPMSQRSEGQRKHIRDYYSNLKRTKIKKINFIARYSKRPFMMPAVQKNIHKLPAIWRSKIQQIYSQ